MLSEDRYRLTANRESLTDDLRPEDVVETLLSDSIITVTQKQDILGKTSWRDQASALCDLLPTCGPKAYSSFRLALSVKYDWLADKLDNTDVTQFKKNTENEKKKDPMTALDDRTFKIITRNSNCMKNWKSIARSLNIDEDEIEDVYYSNERNLREQVYQMLIRWKDLEGRNANIPKLIDALRENGINSVADKLEGYKV
ncbi:unnamed protein product [Owenia fusiformis]|uniref:Uncharacterized protein n=1 Tax=Owenia fusiformis TaxID=6347 RepID=A0A8J1U449_OWEFU|nr:unnamed protein product [Owenia fusiformis]